MKNKKHIVYKTTNLLNGKIYIGAHSTSNLDDGYIGSGTFLRYEIEKYGYSNFKREVLKVCDSRDEAFLIEKEIVNKEFTIKESNYNIVIGGGGLSLSRRRTVKEQEDLFIDLCCSELTYKDISELLELSIKTVDNYRDRLFKKYNVKNRVGLVLYLLKNKIVNLKDL